MATIIRTRDGDFLDSLCQAHYGRLDGVVESVLQANRGLASIREPYPAGVEISFPILESPALESVTLWE